MQITQSLKAIFSGNRSVKAPEGSFLPLQLGDPDPEVGIATNTSKSGNPRRWGLSYPIRRFVQGRESIERPIARVGRRQWVIARGLCLYRTFNLSEVPFAERRNALGVRILQWSPYLQTGQYVSWKGDVAQVWIWDELSRTEEMRSVGVNSAVVLPESVLNPAPDNDIPQLVACKEGVEGRIWKEGLLIANRWWEHLPAPSEWSQFLIANDWAPTASPPIVEEYTWLQHPWARRSSGFDVFDFHNERFWIVIGLLVFSGIFAWKGVELWRFHESIASLEPEFKLLSQQARPLKNARAKAAQYREEVKTLLQLAQYPSPLELFREVVRLIPGTDVEIVEWRYMKNDLEFILKGKGVDPVLYINTFQESPSFRDITAEKTEVDRLKVHMTLNQQDDVL